MPNQIGFENPPGARSHEYVFFHAASAEKINIRERRRRERENLGHFNAILQNCAHSYTAVSRKVPNQIGFENPPGARSHEHVFFRAAPGTKDTCTRAPKARAEKFEAFECNFAKLCSY